MSSQKISLSWEEVLRETIRTRTGTSTAPPALTLDDLREVLGWTHETIKRSHIPRIPVPRESWAFHWRWFNFLELESYHLICCSWIRRCCHSRQKKQSESHPAGTLCAYTKPEKIYIFPAVHTRTKSMDRTGRRLFIEDLLQLQDDGSRIPSAGLSFSTPICLQWCSPTPIRF